MIERISEHEPGTRRVLARLRLARWRMRAAGIGLALEGHKVTSAARTDVRKTWAKAGWRKGAKR